jgi:hypothetical protein
MNKDQQRAEDWHKGKKRRVARKPVLETAAPMPDQPATVRGRGGKRSDAAFVQLNVFVPKDVRHALKVYAVKQEQELSEIVTELLRTHLKLA